MKNEKTRDELRIGTGMTGQRVDREERSREQRREERQRRGRGRDQRQSVNILKAAGKGGDQMQGAEAGSRCEHRRQGGGSIDKSRGGKER